MDEAARLVYADRLLESADPRERERGEFIVAQCALARLAPHTAEWRRAKKREEELSASVTSQGKDDTWTVQSWDRGFPHAIRCSPNKLRKAARTLRELPIARLELFAANKEQRTAPTLGDLAWLAERFPAVESVVFANDIGALGVDPKALRGLLAEDDKSLAWRDRDVPHPAIQAAVTSLHLVGTAPLASFLERPFPRLEELELRSSDRAAMMELSDRPSLKRLLWQAAGDARVAPIARLVANLDVLDVNVRLNAELAKAIAASSITRLTLQHDATDDGLARFEPPRGLRRLSLQFSGGRWYEHTPEKVRYRLPIAEYTHLESLRLGRFILDEEDFGALDFPVLADLQLTECRVEAGALTRLENLWRPTFTRCRLDGPTMNAIRSWSQDAVIVL